MKKRIPNGYQFFPASLTGASNVLANAFLPSAISATNTGRHTIKTINKYKPVDSYKACQEYAKKINMTCEEAIEEGAIIIIHAMPWE